MYASRIFLHGNLTAHLRSTAGREEEPVGAGKTIDDAAKTDDFVVSSPSGPLDRYAARHAAVNIAERQDLGLPIVPAGASEDADILGVRLLRLA